jgi:hypothetical protein
LNFDELDNALEELETRLERLRALYEQYFLGFEKIEPSVPRKDVDRRIYLLRREKIRNTGRRFKLQTLIQRYNTFQQYWQRVCREIENGTYRRHLLRAERLMNPDKQLTIATKRRFGKALALEQQAAAEASGATADAEQELPSDDLEPASEPGTLRPARPPLSPAPLSPAPPSPHALSPAPPRPSQFASEAPTAPRLKPPTPAGRPGTRPTAEPSSTPPADRSFESLELDMGFLGSWVPGADAPPPKAPGKLAPPPKPTSAGRPAGPPPKPESALKAAAPPKPAAPPPAAAPPPKSSPKAAPPPKSSPKAAPPPKSSPKAAPPPKMQSTPRAAPPPKPAAEKPAKPAAAAAAAEARAINDERVKELHQKLMELKRQNQEAGQVSLEGLAKTLRATESKLREQHKNRKIDFDVVIRDGKAIVKPTVR